MIAQRHCGGSGHDRSPEAGVRTPGGHLNFPHVWPGQSRPPSRRRDDGISALSVSGPPCPWHGRLLTRKRATVPLAWPATRMRVSLGGSGMVAYSHASGPWWQWHGGLLACKWTMVPLVRWLTRMQVDHGDGGTTPSRTCMTGHTTGTGRHPRARNPWCRAHGHPHACGCPAVPTARSPICMQVTGHAGGTEALPRARAPWLIPSRWSDLRCSHGTRRRERTAD